MLEMARTFGKVKQDYSKSISGRLKKKKKIPEFSGIKKKKLFVKQIGGREGA
jgi:hypothetical protein